MTTYSSGISINDGAEEEHEEKHFHPRTRPPMAHELKTWPEYYQAVIDGRKPFEVRKNDRDFRVGDVLWLQEWDPSTGNGNYTGRELRRTITYLLSDGPFAAQGFVVLGITEPKEPALTAHDWVQLEQAAAGCTSGIENWPALRAAIRKIVAAKK